MTTWDIARLGPGCHWSVPRCEWSSCPTVAYICPLGACDFPTNSHGRRLLEIDPAHFQCSAMRFHYPLSNGVPSVLLIDA
ncbi:hypothetical protein BDV33DRAFT_127437 [Aspergillus novoparasiticus]|uniref:Uncharacterized protein n=2 Tax=Aspergillus subgen. Circumdati TaxID=2720871 RepID=A0A5N6YB27_9EURO|nr:hypothetical protein BDV33DRAFT_127437 [Aspergillus novoparasiticus]KAE8342428.1 hypothetical protein BDV24DRAFT_130351 [Aspergillus arachidicola]